ncbi:uncharacterized protein K489DRAFT_408671 [Dissoconium aciculare CBS 342.82]|uniref:Uncharacterized protein n=1 Tax=Dissoconium aciculare CBS 342.82 TaxID=1314786 RepID=A0A6J3M8S0_9PEZI|nr:uncharacterized protein K489DRAFT_408671 [Dissoconium aciculare CBS 342.82]KAF1824273.1 hypothetical protein K489DRAFT_408671 [Dissoconium aciculare CBS 342.82]
MAKLLSTRNIMIAGGVGAALYLFPRTVAKVNPIQDGIKTPGTEAIAQRFASGGGTTTHTPGFATKRGTSEEIYTQSNPSGVKSQEFQDNHADQKKDDYGAPGRTWNKTQYGTDKGK